MFTLLHDNNKDEYPDNAVPELVENATIHWYDATSVKTVLACVAAFADEGSEAQKLRLTTTRRLLVLLGTNEQHVDDAGVRESFILCLRNVSDLLVDQGEAPMNDLPLLKKICDAMSNDQTPLNTVDDCVAYLVNVLRVSLDRHSREDVLNLGLFESLSHALRHAASAAQTEAESLNISLLRLRDNALALHQELTVRLMPFNENPNRARRRRP